MNQEKPIRLGAPALRQLINEAAGRRQEVIKITPAQLRGLIAEEKAKLEPMSEDMDFYKVPSAGAGGDGAVPAPGGSKHLSNVGKVLAMVADSARKAEDAAAGGDVGVVARMLQRIKQLVQQAEGAVGA